MSTWIATSASLPPIGQRVLVRQDGLREAIIARLASTRDFWYTDHGFEVGSTWMTHWQPLPGVEEAPSLSPWSASFPASPGFYWLRQEARPLSIAQVTTSGAVLFVGIARTYRAEDGLSGLWLQIDTPEVPHEP